mgnify:CR=1 FL=1
MTELIDILNGNHSVVIKNLLKRKKRMLVIFQIMNLLAGFLKTLNIKRKEKRY